MRTTNRTYNRVIPRDLFNEAKLLKGLGLLILRIHDGMAPDGLTFQQPERDEPFRVEQNPATGHLEVTNVDVLLHGKPLTLYHPYNERDGLTLWFEHGDEAGPVFRDRETFSADFLDLCANLAP